MGLTCEVLLKMFYVQQIQKHVTVVFNGDIMKVSYADDITLFKALRSKNSIEPSATILNAELSKHTYLATTQKIVLKY